MKTIALFVHQPKCSVQSGNGLIKALVNNKNKKQAKMFTITDNKFNEQLILTERVSQDVINDKYIRYFDNDGFELTYLEQEFYRENRVKMSNILNHLSDHHDWIQCNHPNFRLDHCTLTQRWGFDGEAKQQLEKHLPRFPELIKFINIKPKWGLDFALEYYDDEGFTEVIHIERDYTSYNAAVIAKDMFETKILETNWDEFVINIRKRKYQWGDMTGPGQNNWKAQYWGLDSAEIILKVN